MATNSITNAQGNAAAQGTMLSVHVNGEHRQTHARTLADLIAETGYGESKVATALNGDFVPQRARGSTSLKTGDHVEIVAPRQGG